VIWERSSQPSPSPSGFSFHGKRCTRHQLQRGPEYGGRKPDELTAVLRSHGVITVVDVRLRPDRAALGAYAKARTPDKGIEKLMRDAGFDYVSLVELGNLFVDLEDWERRYTDLLKAAGPFLIERLVGLPAPCCLLCCEKDPAQCHRRLIAEYMAARGWTVEHIL
jgi:uncharacterized protein (DUF488 family)